MVCLNALLVQSSSLQHIFKHNTSSGSVKNKKPIPKGDSAALQRADICADIQHFLSRLRGLVTATTSLQSEMLHHRCLQTSGSYLALHRMLHEL